MNSVLAVCVVVTCLCHWVGTYMLSVSLFTTWWTAAHQALLYMEFSRQEYWTRLPFPPPGSPWPRDRTPVFWVFCITRQILYHWTTWEDMVMSLVQNIPLYEHLSIPLLMDTWIVSSRFQQIILLCTLLNGYFVVPGHACLLGITLEGVSRQYCCC